MSNVAIFLIALFLGIILSRLWYKFIYTSHPTVKKLDRIGRHKGYHFHHSMYGLTSFMAVPFALRNHHFLTTLILIGFGLGLIIDHTIEEGFVFITKEEELS
jgi:hypothetical protein